MRRLPRSITCLEAKHLLLILDNCEHLIDAAAGMAEEVLRACPQVHLLATSSQALHIGAEIPWRVPSLTQPPSEFVVERPEAKVPDRATHTDGLRLSLAELGEYEAVALFVNRVRVFQPALALSANNARAIAQICGRLDGIPLALEMAAAQADALTVEEIVARLSGALDARFQLLTSASRTAPRRQQTLRAASSGATPCSHPLNSACWQGCRSLPAAGRPRQPKLYARIGSSLASYPKTFCPC